MSGSNGQDKLPSEGGWGGKAAVQEARSNLGCSNKGYGTYSSPVTNWGSLFSCAWVLPSCPGQIQRNGTGWILNGTFGCSLVLTPGKQITELLSCDVHSSSWFSPEFPGWKQLSRLKILHSKTNAGLYDFSSCAEQSHTQAENIFTWSYCVSSEKTLDHASKEYNGKTQTG